MNSSLSAKQLRAAAALAESRMLAELDFDEAQPHEFSESFERKMEPVLKKARSRERARQTARTIAASLAVVVLFGLIWIATHAEAREAVQKWFTFKWNNIITYRFTEEYTGEFPTYRPTWLPDGFEEYKIFDPPGYCEVTYIDDAGNHIFFHYSEMDEGTDIGIGAMPGEEFRIEKVMIRGLQGDLYISSLEGEQSDLIWMDEKQGIVFGVDGILDEDVILKIAESVEIVKPEK